MRNAAAVIAGYVVLAVLIGVKFALVQQVAPATFTSLAGLWFILATDALSAAAGGFVVALVAPRKPMAHALALSAIMVPLGIANAVANAGQEPLWFQIAVLVVIAVSVPAGAWLRVRTAAATLTPSSAAA